MVDKLEIRRWVDEWIKESGGGWFYNPQIWSRFNIITREGKDTVWHRLNEHFEKGVLEKDGLRWRKIQDMPVPVDWQQVNGTKDFPLTLPFDLRKYVWIDYDSLIIVAGSKDSGKTGFLMRTIVMNMLNPNFHTIFLTNMEGGLRQIKRRFSAMDIKIPNPAPFDVYFALDNFHDLMKFPNTFYVIDYIDVPESGEFYMIAPALGKIQAKLIELKNSAAMIGLQKHSLRDSAFGGEQTIKKASLYLLMDKGKLKIRNAKVHANPTIDPTNMTWTFKYKDEGTRFDDIRIEGLA